MNWSGSAKRIQATVAMLADPDRADLDEIKKSLVDLKGKREALETRRRSARQARQSTYRNGSPQLAKQRFQKSGPWSQTANRTSKQPAESSLFVERIDIDPKSRSGKLILPADARLAWIQIYHSGGARRSAGRIEGEG